uniref:Uncharacterized protein n=1 Tax=Anopheles dirus TaxID=7168 RepID=A0A182NNU5_9DIPT
MTDLSRHPPRQGSATTFGSGSSIYDYPEHLNPFYEDENHKRLRFLEHKPRKSQRRGSLSSLRDGLRELWQFSSIRFGKKRSSTLGVNKTSESPPPLRRDVYEPDSNDTFAARSSYSANQSYTTTPLLFVRHERYRSSLQNRPKDNDGIGFVRNDRYRSTVQNGFATYDTRMVTSTPRKKQAAPQPGYGTTPRAMQHQQQLNNTNPFDTEMEQDGDTMSMISVDSSYSSTLRSRTSGTRTRTKRRAPPPPPVSVSPANRVVPTTSVEEPSPVADDLRCEDLHNLTAEIESFVRISTKDGGDAYTSDAPTVPAETRVETRVDQAFDVNNNSAQPEIPTTISTIEREIVREEQIGEGAKRESLEEVKQSNVERVTESSNDSRVPLEASEPVVEQHTTTTVTIDTAVTASTTQSNPTPSPRKKHDEPQSEVTGRQADIDFENLALPETPVPMRRSNRENREMYITQDVTTVAKVTNERPVVVASAKPQLAPTTEEPDDEGPTTTIIVDNLQYKLKVVPIQTEINTKIESARMKISESTGNIPTAANDTNGTPTERRRSVRDIIESINKSQSMLKVNHEQSSNGLHETQSTDSMTRNIRELNEREREIQSLLEDIDTRYGNSGGGVANEGTDLQAPMPTGRGSYYDNLADDNLNDNLDDRSNMYAASGGFRVKKSPTKTVIIGETDETQFQDCINWNPLPKPRRTHNLADSAPDAEQQPSVGTVAHTSPSS